MRVLVATDLSESSAVALREGAALASSRSDELAVVHVLPPFQTVSAAVLDLAAADVSARAARAVRGQVAKVIDRHDVAVFIDEGHAHVHTPASGRHLAVEKRPALADAAEKVAAHFVVAKPESSHPPP
jgi:nucleotide-binding universal stress UspA family protein